MEGRSDIRIADPAAVEDLLDLALERARDRHRVIFFCACEIPGHEDRNGCHRTAVARLAIEAASRRRLAIRVQEWPGGEPSHDAALVVGPDVVRKLDRGAKSVPLGEPEFTRSRRAFALVFGAPMPDTRPQLVAQRAHRSADLIRLAGELRARDGYNAVSGRPIGSSG